MTKFLGKEIDKDVLEKEIIKFDKQDPLSFAVLEHLILSLNEEVNSLGVGLFTGEEELVEGLFDLVGKIRSGGEHV